MPYPLPGETRCNTQERRESVTTRQDNDDRHTPPQRAASQTESDQQTDQTVPPPNDDGNPRRDWHGNATPGPRNDPPRSIPNQPRRRREQLKLASLNMNGQGNRSQDRWGSINNVMKRRQIAILGLQETPQQRNTREHREEIPKRPACCPLRRSQIPTQRVAYQSRCIKA